MEPKHFKQEVEKLTQIGIALTSILDLDELLEMIVREARHFTAADAGSLYLRENDQLEFAISQNDTLTQRLGEEGERALFESFSLPISTDSIAGFVASTKENLNIPNVYDLDPGLPYHFNPDFDLRNQYRTQSVLSVPMLDQQNRVLGVLQLINARQGGQVIPFDPAREHLVRSMASQAAVAVKNARLTAEIKKVHLDTIMRLSVAAEYKDHDTAQHIHRVSRYSQVLARQLGLSLEQVELILYASPMHDIGKIGVADSILLKPGRLTPEERKHMQEHTTIGAHILAGSDSAILQMSEQVALSHHEKWDGSGYPQGLAGQQIPQVGRIVAVADVFDALRSKRVYKSPVSLEQTMSILQKDSGTHFDPACIQAFSDIIDEVTQIHAQYQDSQ